MAYFTVILAESRRSASSRKACWAWETAIPYPGTMTTACAFQSSVAASSMVPSFTPPPAGPPLPPPPGGPPLGGGALPPPRAECAEEDICEGTVHGPAHHDGQQEAGRPVK